MELVKQISPAQEISQFLDYLYGDETGYVYAPYKDVETDTFGQKFYSWPSEKSELISWLGSSVGRELYVAPALFNEASARKDSFKVTRVLWTEFDGVVPSSFGSIPKPTMRIQSSDENHIHCYWLLSEPLTDPTQVEAYNRTLAYQLNADASAWDCNQVLRPPGTHNQKRDMPVVTQSVSDVALSVGLFVPTYPSAEIAEINPDVIPDVADIVYKYPFPSEVVDLFKTTKLPVGDRSTALMRIGYSCAEMGMSDAEIFSLLRNADDRWGKFKGRLDRNQRLIDLIARVREKYPTTEFQTDVIPVFGFQSFLEHEVHVDWVIPGLLQEQGYMLFVGPSGVGKTQFTLRMMLNIALGRDWLGFKIDKPRKILLFSLEMGHADLKYFVSIMAKDLEPADRELLEENFIIVPHGEAIYLDTKEGQDNFMTIVEEIKPDGVVIDSVGSTTTGNITDEGPVMKLMDFNDKLRKRYHVFTWWIHHMRKAQGDNKKPNKMSDVYGNQFLVNRATSVYCLWPKYSKIEVIPLKKRLSAVEEPWFVARVGNLEFSRTAEVTVLSSDPDQISGFTTPPLHVEERSIGEM